MAVEMRLTLDVSPALVDLVSRLIAAGARSVGGGGNVEVPPSSSKGGTGDVTVQEKFKPLAPAVGVQAAGALNLASAVDIVSGAVALNSNLRQGVFEHPTCAGAPGPSPAADAGPLPQVPPAPPGAAPAATRAVKRTKGPGGVLSAGGWRTEARRALLLDAWPAGVPRPEIVAAMDALPGPAVVATAVSVWAANLGLQRTPEYLRGLAAAKKRPRESRQPAAVAASNQERGVEAARARSVVEAAPVVVAEPVASVVVPLRAPSLPPISANGKIYAVFEQIKAWAAFNGVTYDGRNLDLINKFRSGFRLAPLVQTEGPAA
ncbi:hypothetical protein [Sandarakinorhabdus sp.]|uniref:hypothetical protein n=1 Tax=Sandarakinorhabdus sp. TaxID=1916663 RepID=UPI003565AD04